MQARDAAALGPTSFENEPIWETTLVAGNDTVVAVFNVGPRQGGDTRIGYAVAKHLQAGGRSAWSWRSEGIVPLAQGMDRAIDPSIVFDAFAPQGTGKFLLVGLLRDEVDEKHIAVTRYNVAEASWSAWESLFQAASSDRPWIVAGTATALVQEFYIIFVGPGGYYRYLRTTNGGLLPKDWDEGPMTVSGQQVEGAAAHRPAVYADGPLYFAYIRRDQQSGRWDKIRFVKGVDIDDPNDPDFGGVEFDWLPARPPPGGRAGGPGVTIPLEFELMRTGVEAIHFLPGHEGDWYAGGAKTQPVLAVDPTDANRLFVVYHDTLTDAPDDTDVNIYVREIRREHRGWVADEPIQVNSDPMAPESDQFLPEAYVDPNGYIHVTFYDDRRYDQSDDEPDPEFDVWYAWAPVDDVNFDPILHPERNRLLFELFDDPNDPNEPPALDFTLDVEPFVFELGEYNGITWYRNTEAQRDEIWTCYTGTKPTLDPDDESLIWSSRIDWAWTP